MSRSRYHIRQADVTVLDDDTSAVLGSGSTAEDGSFAVVCTSGGIRDVVVRVDGDTNLAGGQRIRVTTDFIADEVQKEHALFLPDT